MHAALLLGMTGARLPTWNAASPSPMHARLVQSSEQPEAAPMTETKSTPAPVAAQRSSEAPALQAATNAPELPASVPPRKPAPSDDARVNPPPPPEPPAHSAATNPAAAQPAAYRPSSELDTPPRPIDSIEPEYPAEAGLEEGSVVLRLSISDTGIVDEVVVVSAQPPGLFDASAVAAFGKARFSPGRILGLPVRSQMTVAVDYAPVNRGSAVSGSGAGIGR